MFIERRVHLPLRLLLCHRVGIVVWVVAVDVGVPAMYLQLLAVERKTLYTNPEDS